VQCVADGKGQGRREMCEGFCVQNMNEKDCSEDQDVEGKMTTNGHYRDAVRGRGVDCIHLAQYRGKWRAFVNKATNTLDAYSAGNLSIS
jgi:hypothetical protein